MERSYEFSSNFAKFKLKYGFHKKYFLWNPYFSTCCVKGKKVCYFATKNCAKFEPVHVVSNGMLLCYKKLCKIHAVHVSSKGMQFCYKQLCKHKIVLLVYTWFSNIENDSALLHHLTSLVFILYFFLFKRIWLFEKLLKIKDS